MHESLRKYRKRFFVLKSTKLVLFYWYENQDRFLIEYRKDRGKKRFRSQEVS